MYGLTNPEGDGPEIVTDENCLSILEEYGRKPPPSEKEAERIKKMHLSWVENRAKKAGKPKKVVKKVAKKPVVVKRAGAKAPARSVRRVRKVTKG
jgi:topoisomerase IA-like protein